MNHVLRFLGALLAVWLTVELSRLFGHIGLPVRLEWGGAWHAAIFVLVLGLINAVIRPVIKFFTVPLTCLTLGLFTFVVNAVLFWVAASVTGGVEVKGFVAALFGSVVLSFLSGIVNSVVKRRQEA